MTLDAETSGLSRKAAGISSLKLVSEFFGFLENSALFKGQLLPVYNRHNSL
ncbi:hypothetical protein RintRC_5887 [Richelia intracellularis]|nr:hypothetical protein RintRC_5887 [Richelia intracellularis]